MAATWKGSDTGPPGRHSNRRVCGLPPLRPAGRLPGFVCSLHFELTFVSSFWAPKPEKSVRNAWVVLAYGGRKCALCLPQLNTPRKWGVKVGGAISINQSVTYKVHGEPAEVSWDWAEKAGGEGCVSGVHSIERGTVQCGRRLAIDGRGMMPSLLAKGRAQLLLGTYFCWVCCRQSTFDTLVVYTPVTCPLGGRSVARPRPHTRARWRPPKRQQDYMRHGRAPVLCTPPPRPLLPVVGEGLIPFKRAAFGWRPVGWVGVHCWPGGADSPACRKSCWRNAQCVWTNRTSRR